MFKRTRISGAAALAIGGLAVIASAPAFAQEVQRVEITGSSIKRIEAEGALPVTIFKREDIDKSGATNVQEFVDRLTANNGGGRSLGESIGETSAPGQTGASLRNLGRERTLVLLNGRRLSAYPFSGLGVDLNAIPLAAIERIELLRDGASAVYGSDAIGGVLNFITRKDLRGGEISGSFEQPMAAGGGGQVGGAFGAGVGDLAKDRFNILGTLSYQKYDVLKSASRDFAATGNRPDLGIIKDSGNSFPANTRLVNLDANGNFTGVSTRVPAVAGYPNCFPPDSFNRPDIANQCRYDFTSKIDIYPESERIGAFTRASFQLDADNQLFAEYAFSKNTIRFGISQTPSVSSGSQPFLFPGTVGTFSSATLSPYYPTAKVDAVRPGYRGPLAISWRIVDGGQRVDLIDNYTNRFIVGAEGVLGGWDYKAAFMLNGARAVDTSGGGQYSETKLRAALKTGLVNPFGPNDAVGLATLKTAELTGVVLRNSKTSSDGFDASISRELFKLGGGAAGLALGLDVRKEKYDDGYSDIAGSGDIVGGSGTAGAVTGQRDVRGLFAEINMPVTKGLEFGLAVRNDRYSSVSGSSRDGAFTGASSGATSPKVSVRFQPTQQILLRASAGKGFRAPAMDNLFAPSSLTNTGGQFNDPYYNANVLPCTDPNADTNRCAAQLDVQNNSNPALKPEKSKQVSFGLVLEPVRDLSFTLDYFDIKITDGITALTGDDILNDWYAHQTGPTTSTSVYANRLVVNPVTGVLDYVRASLENVGKAQVAGYDMSLRYKIRTGAGTFTPGWEATVLTKSTTTNIVTGAEGDNLGQYARQGPAIKVKQVFTLGYEEGGWDLSGRLYRQGGYIDADGTSNVDSYNLVDVQASYKGIKNFTLTAGVKNLFDKKPPVSVQQDYFQVGFDPTYADVKLRTLYVRGNYKF
jgi:iron complex outermembrane receptor protein